MPDRWGWQVEIIATVPDSPETWIISQKIEEHRVIDEYDSAAGGTASFDSGITHDSEVVLWVSQSKDGHRIYAIDAPGVPNLPEIRSVHTVMNFTTILSRGEVSKQIEWSVVLKVTNRRLMEANFYPHHSPIR